MIIGSLKKAVFLFRYRFFLFAGIFPYLLGQIIAFHQLGFLNTVRFFIGLLGIIFVLIGVELFNEYFDSREGGDRVFLRVKPKVNHYFFPLGLLVMLLAFFIALYLTLQVGWLVLGIAFLGFLGAYFYVGPPIKWAYRGWGEIVIGLCYGPFMILGSYYIQTEHMAFLPIFISFVCAFSLFGLTILNEIPDYYQDRLVGKKNLVVRLGREKAGNIFFLSTIAVYLLLGIGIILGYIPIVASVYFFFLPWFIESIKIVRKYYDNPKTFLRAVNICVIGYVALVVSLGISYGM